MNNNIDDNDLINKSDEDLKNETLKILEEDVFEENEKISKTKVKNSSNEGYKNSSEYHNYSYTSRDETSKYNNYNSYSDEEELVADIKNKRGIKVIFVFILAIFVLFALILSVFFSFNDYDDYDDYDYSYEDVYDVEYDLDNDGYLDYDEREVYEDDKTSDYVKLINVSELFNDKKYKELFFKIENNNNYIIDNATLNIAFYDNENNLMFVEKSYIDNLPMNKEVLVSQHYEKEFDHMEATVTVDLGYGTPREKDADVIVVSSNIERDEYNSVVKYTIKNNDTLSARGDLYIIFYDSNGEIITIKEDYFYDIKPGEELDEEYNFYYDDVEDLNLIEIDVSNFVYDVY